MTVKELNAADEMVMYADNLIEHLEQIVILTEEGWCPWELKNLLHDAAKDYIEQINKEAEESRKILDEHYQQEEDELAHESLFW